MNRAFQGAVSTLTAATSIGTGTIDLQGLVPPEISDSRSTRTQHKFIDTLDSSLSAFRDQSRSSEITMIDRVPIALTINHGSILYYPLQDIAMY